MAEAQNAGGDLLSAVRTLIAPLGLQQRGDTEKAADVIVQLRHLWTRDSEGVATASCVSAKRLCLSQAILERFTSLADVAAVEVILREREQHLKNYCVPLMKGESWSILTLSISDLRDLDVPEGDQRLAVIYYQKALDGSDETATRAFNALEKSHRNTELGDVAQCLR